MLVKDAIKLLENCKPDNQLVIEDTESFSCAGTPFFAISDRSFFDGFDWNNGKTFIRILKDKE